MATKRITLGRDLSALLGSSANTVTNASITSGDTQKLAIDKLSRGKYQPRSTMDDNALQELASSIKSQGIIQPIVVRKLPNSNYEILAGERRWTAAKLANLTEVPVIIKNVDDKGALAIALIENLQREDLNALEEARALSRLIEEFSITHEEAASSVGKSRATVSNLIRLLSLHQSVQDLLEKGSIEMGHARALLPLDSAMQFKLASMIIQKNFTVRQTESWVRNINKPQSKLPPKTLPNDLIQIQQELKELYSMPVSIKPSGANKGKIVISYKNKKELNSLIEHAKEIIT